MRKHAVYLPYAVGQMAKSDSLGQFEQLVLTAVLTLREDAYGVTVLPSDYKDALMTMQDKLVNVEIRDSSSGLLQLFSNATPFLLLLGVWIFLMIRKFPNGPRQGFLG
jgi:ATP-dependent Zn protease